MPSKPTLTGAALRSVNSGHASQAAIRVPICSPASSCRKCEAFSIFSGGAALIAAANRSPTLNGMIGSASAHRWSLGR